MTDRLTSLELTEDGQVVPLNWFGRLLLRIFGAERIVRFDERLMARPARPDSRCEWTAAFSGDQCTRRAKHPGSCCTVDYVNGSPRYRYWYGINYTITKEPPGVDR